MCVIEKVLGLGDADIEIVIGILEVGGYRFHQIVRRNSLIRRRGSFMAYHDSYTFLKVVTKTNVHSIYSTVQYSSGT